MLSNLCLRIIQGQFQVFCWIALLKEMIPHWVKFKVVKTEEGFNKPFWHGTRLNWFH